MMLSGAPLRAHLLTYCEPPRTIHYDAQRATLWPIVLPAFCALCTVLAFIVVSNHDSAVCSEQLRFERWQGAASEARGCRAVDSISQWTLYATNFFLSHPDAFPMFSFPSMNAEEESPWNPTSCTVDGGFPIAYHRWTINVTRRSYLNGSLDVVMAGHVRWPGDVSIFVWIVGQVPAAMNQYLLPGVVRADSEPYSPNNTRVTGSTFPVNTTVVRNFLVLYLDAPHLLLTYAYTSACVEYSLKKHLQSCYECAPSSPASITSIIVLGVLQALAVTWRVTLWLLHHCNRGHMLGPQDDSLLELSWAQPGSGTRATASAGHGHTSSDLDQPLFQCSPGDFL